MFQRSVSLFDSTFWFTAIAIFISMVKSQFWFIHLTYLLRKRTFDSCHFRCCCCKQIKQCHANHLSWNSIFFHFASCKHCKYHNTMNFSTFHWQCGIAINCYSSLSAYNFAFVKCRNFYFYFWTFYSSICTNDAVYQWCYTSERCLF